MEKQSSQSKFANSSWEVRQNGRLIYGRRERSKCILWMYDQGLVINNQGKNELAEGYEVVPAA